MVLSLADRNGNKRVLRFYSRPTLDTGREILAFDTENYLPGAMGMRPVPRLEERRRERFGEVFADDCVQFLPFEHDGAGARALRTVLLVGDAYPLE